MNFRLVPISIVMVAGLARIAAAQAVEPAAEYFKLSQVRLLDGPFKHAQEVDARYILALEPDRLLAPFRSEAGLEPKAAVYGNWEGTGLGGHTAGHYLTALAQMIAAGGEPEMRRRLDYMVAELAACQEANGNGYVGGTPNSRRLWQRVAGGDIRAGAFDLNGAWVPWYNLHKLYAGLRDAYLIAGNEQAREVLVKLSDWCGELVAGLTDEQVQRMLGAEHGGMNEVLADVTVLTGDPKYLALARRFSDRSILEPLAAGRDELTGKHANTQIPKAIGFQRIHELDGEPAMGAAARFFWDAVTQRRSIAIGGNSVDEHFNPVDDYEPMIENRSGVETCNTYNMLRLTELLFRESPRARYADFYERGLYNHILSSQHPEHGGFVYFTPMRPGHYRVYSQPGQAFWCCVGSGIENHGKYGAFIYAYHDDSLFVNLYMASELKWEERGLSVRQETRFPDDPRSRLTLSLAAPTPMTIRVRHPGWVEAGAFRVSVNGEPWPLESRPSSYAAITRTWRDGDTVAIELPMRTTLERPPDGSPWGAFVHGPIVLAATVSHEGLEGLLADDDRWAHIAHGPLPAMEEAPTLVGDPEQLVRALRPVPGKALTFTVPETVRPERYRGLELIPFSRLHDARYVIYWRLNE